MLATGLVAATAAPVMAVDLFDRNCEFAGRCAYDEPRGGRVFRPIVRPQPPSGVTVPTPGPVPVMPRGNVQIKPNLQNHIRWCLNRYRSYRTSDDTFAPRAGVRRYCISPFSG